MSLTSIICGIALLTIGEVGPQNMPDTIEPVESPFVMPLFERPVFPESTILVRMEQEGMSTKPIQEAIDSMSRRGELALRLRSASARHVAAREPGELRFQLDPKERI